jgi:hypothetical protein
VEVLWAHVKRNLREIIAAKTLGKKKTLGNEDLDGSI